MASPGPPSGSGSMGPLSGVPPGGIPDKTDTILSAIFIPLFFLTGLYFHFRIFHAFGRRFVWSILCFGFCMARIAALTFRIVVVKHATSTGLNIVAQVLIAAGVVLLFFVNLQMSRRFFGQLHPQHSVIVKYFVNFWACLILPILALVITTVIQSFITKDPHILSIDRTVRLVASCFMVLLPFLPIPIVLLCLILRMVGSSVPVSPVGVDDPEYAGRRAEKFNGDANGDVSKHFTTIDRVKGEPKTGFGPRPMSSREIIESALAIVIPAMLLTLEQGVRCAQAFHVPKPGQKTPWYMTKPAFWVCIFGVELISVFIFGLAVLPRRFSHLRVL